jgi:cellulose synthase/poly-beta-1,6-N-acetylglucosamine synthase-like glycosyltransferase
MLHLFAFVLTTVYVLGMLTFFIVLILARYSQSTKYRPTVSIIIAARNEERILRNCLRSMTTLTYPKELLEVIVVDDRSTDATTNIVKEYEATHPFIKLVSVGPLTDRLHGKVNALEQGISASKGEILLFTDADCVVPRGWVENMVKYYADPQVGLVTGFISIRAFDWFDSIQAIDWLLLLSAASATAKLGFPVTAVGNNFSVRRRAYDLVGGYRGIRLSVTEDFSLFHAVTSKAGMRATVALDKETMVLSNSCRTWSELYSQRKRWFIGGRDSEVSRMVAFGVAYIFNAFVLLGFLFLALPTWGTMVAAKMIADYLMVLPALRLTGRTDLAKYWILFELYFIAYVAFLPIDALLKPRVTWKGRTFKVTKGELKAEGPPLISRGRPF